MKLPSLLFVFLLPPVAVSAGTVADPADYLRDFAQAAAVRWPKNRTLTIVSHGHSVPAGYMKAGVVRTFDAYPHLLHVGLNDRFPHAVIRVIPTAIGGEHAEQGATRFVAGVLSLRPDVITLDYGLNDRAIGLARAETAWRAMIEAALAAGTKVILLTPTPDAKADLANPDDPLRRHAQLIRDLAAEYQVGLVDSLAAFDRVVASGTELNDLLAQNNHPNRAGHEIVARALLTWFSPPPLILNPSAKTVP